MGAEVIFTQPYVFSIENHEGNIQGDAQMTLPPVAIRALVLGDGLDLHVLQQAFHPPLRAEPGLLVAVLGDPGEVEGALVDEALEREGC